MKLTVKTIQQQQFVLDVEPTETIAQVKTKIEGQGQGLASLQKLIYAGKVLDDTTTIAAANMKENDFLVLMVKRPTKEEPAKPSPATTPKPVEKPVEAKPAEKPVEAKPTTAEKPATTPSTTGTSTGIAMGADYERAVTQLMEMGFAKEEVAKAMRAAFNNPDRAVEYLFNGIPNLPEAPQPSPQRTAQSPVPAPQQPTQSPVPAQQPSQPSSAPFLSPNTPLLPPQFLGQQPTQTGQQATTGSGVFDFLRQHPHFNTLRMMVQQQPELLQPVLQQLGQTNPSILQLIQSHQQEFIQLLNEPVQMAPGQQTGGPAQGPGMPPLGPQYIQVSTEEKAAIDRLEKLGFDRSLVIEAFFACDKDEQLAANYLLEHMGEEMLDEEQNQ